MNKVCPSSVQKFYWNCFLFNFFLELDMVLGAHVALSMADLGFLKIIFLLPKMGKRVKNEANIEFFECRGKFSD